MQYKFYITIQMKVIFVIFKSFIENIICFNKIVSVFISLLLTNIAVNADFVFTECFIR